MAKAKIALERQLEGAKRLNEAIVRNLAKVQMP
jgi:hypothetical protein